MESQMGKPRTKVSIKHPRTGKWVIGVLFPPLGIVMLAHAIYKESYLKRIAAADGGIGYHETFQNGKVIQKTGKYTG